MNERPAELLRGWSDKTITLERIEGLMGRGSALALAMEKWLRAGLWVMTRSDPDYPARLKKRLRTDSPPVLFGCGNRALLSGGGLAVVGSRNASEQDLAYSRSLGARAASEGFSIVSGGARGVDESAMLGALEAEGTVIGCLADNLMRACSTAKYRKHLMANNIALISPFYPEVGFNVGNAMQRNKYIYCLSDAAMVVHSGKKGGTWTGAIENEKRQWVPLWVKRTTDPKAGNASIVKAGGVWAPESVKDIDFRLLFSPRSEAVRADADLFSQAASQVGESATDHTHESLDDRTADSMVDECKEAGSYPVPEDAGSNERSSEQTMADEIQEIEFYDLFIAKAGLLCRDAPKTPDELVEALDLNKTQLNAWLKRAVSEKKLKKQARPVRYQTVTDNQSGFPF